MLMRTGGTEVSTGKELGDVKRVTRKMSALIRYAAASKDMELVTRAVDAKLEAEREGGLALIAMAQNGQRATAGRPKRSQTETILSLDDMGITKSDSSRWQSLARMDDVAFSRPDVRRETDTQGAVTITKGWTGMLMKVDGKKRQLSTGEELKSVQRVSRKMSAVIKYAVASRDQTLATEAVETKYNAEREGGLTLGVMAQNGERYGGRGGNRKSNVAPTFDLETIGITPHESSRWQTLAKMSDVDFSRAKFNAVKRAWNAWEKGKREDEREANPKAAGEALNNLKQIAESGRKFPVIYADPPWAFEVYSGKGKDRSADRHYDTQSLDTIKALPVAQVAEKDCALFMWCVMPELPGALAVIEAWGFKYKTAAFAWLKTTSEGKPAWGMGYWTRANIELCLLATRGAPTRLAKDVHQVILEPRQEHSRKPDEARTRIMRLVDGPYLELYARECAPGWTAWGDQMPPLVLPTESAA